MDTRDVSTFSEHTDESDKAGEITLSLPVIFR